MEVYIMKTTEIILNEERRVKLSAWIMETGGEFAPVGRRPAVLVLPGGGYSMCSDREADPVGTVFLNAGYQVFILRYSVGEYRAWPNPLNDYEQAMEMIRGNADEWHLDPERVAVIGFSAGGHLAACAATVAKNRPNAAILGYAALTKEICDMCQPGMPYPVETVDGKTPPCFLFAACDDNTVDIRNTTEFANSLAEKGIRFESHIYAYGGHGFSTAAPWLNGNMATPRACGWTKDCLGWLEEMWGSFEKSGFTEPACGGKLNGDFEEFLSVDCTRGFLLRQSKEAQEIMKPYIDRLDALLFQRFGENTKVDDFLEKVKLKDILDLLQIPENERQELNAQLKKIPAQR